MTDLQVENDKIEGLIREKARELLKDNKVDIIIGYSKGTYPLASAPIFVRKEEEVDELTWNNLCYINLAKYLIPEICDVKGREKIPKKVGVVAKGCTARAIIHQALEKQVNLENITVIGIPCNGIINRRKIEREIGEREILDVSFQGDKIIVKGADFEERFPYKDYMNDLCNTCKIKAPPAVDGLNNVGESQDVSDVEDDFADLDEYEALSTEEKWAHIKELLKDCTRCYACREACPLCFCALCFVDQNVPTWFGKTTDISDIIIFHMIRALHLAGRCVECGACSVVCPVGIELGPINRKIGRIVKERYDFIAGLSLEALPPMMTQKMDDSEDFMLGGH